LHAPPNQRNNKILYDKPLLGSGSAMQRYASRDNMFEKGYDSLGSGCGSQERLHTEGHPLAKQSTKQLASVSSL